MSRRLYISLFFILLVGCSGLEDSEKQKIRKVNAIKETIYRAHDDQFFSLSPPKRRNRKAYSWEEKLVGNQCKITKEFFRCKGSSHNQPILRHLHGHPQYVFDCGGKQQHSLPLKEGKEFIYPILMDLLNFVQEKTNRKVIITSGHRCPTHNAYADPKSRVSKHMVGAEVNFYVQGFEWSPEKVIKILMQYYEDDPHLCVFDRFEQETNVSTYPWYNKEVFIKLFKKDEGRNLDNSHGFPYISIQVKWDRDRDERVSYSWSKAFNGYLRY